MARQGISFELRGVPGLKQDLEEATKEIRQQVGAAVQVTSARVVSRAKQNAPVDEGALRDNIAAAGKGLNWRVGILDTAIPSRGKNTARQHPWAYGIWYEYGFTTRKIAARPFMGPALDAEDQPHYDRVRASLGKAIV